jgi:hypothetical protein
MLPRGIDVCPICGARLGKSAQSKELSSDPATAIDGREIFWLSAYIIGIALIPILIFIVIGFLCILFSRSAFIGAF